MLLLNLRELIYDNPAKRDKVIMITFLFCLAVNAALWALLLLRFWNFGDYIILDYNVYFGISMLGPWYQILMMPFLGLLIIAADFLLSFYFYLKNILVSRTLAITALGFNLIMLAGGLFLMFVN